MPLRPLVATSCLLAYRDARYDVLVLELEGQLTRVEAQAICGQVAQLARHRHYAQVIINASHLRFEADCPLSLAVQLLSLGLTLLGAHQLAWVCRSSLSSLTAGHLLLARLAIPASLFADVEHAATWLRSYSTPTKLRAELTNPYVLLEAPRQPVAVASTHEANMSSDGKLA